MYEIKVTIDAPHLEGAIRMLAAAIEGLRTGVIVENTETPKETSVTQSDSPSVTTEYVAADTDTVQPAAEPVCTVEELARAGAALIDQGKMPQLIDLLKKNGVQAITQLKPEQYAAVATELIALGAKL